MKYYEYNSLKSIAKDFRENESILNEFGLEGWELVSVVTYPEFDDFYNEYKDDHIIIFYFKREITQEQAEKLSHNNKTASKNG